jgi:hypothetical protein
MIGKLLRHHSSILMKLLLSKLMSNNSKLIGASEPVRHRIVFVKILAHLLLVDQDIGVITPYHAQCQKIRNALRNVADEVKVASVEDF